MGVCVCEYEEGVTKTEQKQRENGMGRDEEGKEG